MRSAPRIADAAAVGADGDNAAPCRDDIVPADEAGNERARRLLEDLARRAGLADMPLIHHHHQVGQRHRFVLAVRDMDEANAKLALQAFQFLAHADPQKRVKSRQRFVKQQHVRFGNQRACERDALLLAAG